MPHTLIVLLGPTAVGKTELSLAIATRQGIGVISADSRQMYRDLKIGTAAPTPQEQQRVRHYFVGNLALTDYYSAAQYESEVMRLLESEFIKSPVQLLSGGSMMYLDAVCNGIDDLPTVDADTRHEVKEQYNERGLEGLCTELKLLDPDYYKIVDLKNPKRVMHAIEICLMTGKPYSSLLTRTKKERPFDILKIGLMRDREELYQRIGTRVDKMMEEGLLEEARTLYPHRELNALNTVGYKELFRYFDGEWDLPFAVEKIKQDTRIYSRKQMTWFRRDPSIHWFAADRPQEVMHFIEKAVGDGQ